MPNQRALAKALGMNQSTVSRALRNDELIPAETRRLVQEAAERMGYQPSPLISRLMERVRSGRDIRDQGCLALVVDAKNADEWLKFYTYREQYEGIQARAARGGYRTETFFLRAPGMSARRIDSILEARGITGVILTTPKRPDTEPPVLHWERYACVTTGYSWESPLVDRVSTRHRHNVDRCFAELLRRGYQRIGMVLLASSVRYADSNWSASYLLNQSRLPEDRRLPLFISHPESDQFPTFEKWYRRWRPDALITSHGAEVAWAERLGLTRETLGIVCFNRPPLPEVAGMDENSRVVGRMACDLVISKLAHNESGLPQHPRLILIEGTWRDGESLPPEEA